MAKQSLPNSNSKDKKCSVDPCDRPRRCWGLCTVHYQRKARTGDVIAHFKNWGTGSTVAERFWSRVDKSKGPDACWPWTAGKGNRGYGQLQVNKQRWLAHRFAFFLANGYDAPRLVLHGCDNRVCCNPSHLRDGNYQDNAQDAIKRNRGAFGERHPDAKLTENQVREIRQLYGTGSVSLRTLSNKYGLHNSTVHAIVLGRTWKRIEKLESGTETSDANGE